jgi:ABC-2 type transport system permease protein
MSTISGGAVGYRPARTLPVRVELVRQLRRRRTQIAIGFLVVLPFLLLIAFKVGNGNPNRNSGQLVDLATQSASNFTVFALFASASFLLVVIVALFCGDTVASEASSGSLRYLLAAPVPRRRLLGVKYAVGLLSSAAALVVLTGVTLAVGAAAFGWHPLVTMTGDTIEPGPALARIAGVVGYLAIVLLVPAALAFLLSVCTDNALGAVGGAVLLVIVSSILDQVTALGGLRALLPTHYEDAYTGLLTDPIRWDLMVRGAFSALIYAGGFTALAWWRFLRKDVTS